MEKLNKPLLSWYQENYKAIAKKDFSMALPTTKQQGEMGSISPSSNPEQSNTNVSCQDSQKKNGEKHPANAKLPPRQHYSGKSFWTNPFLIKKDKIKDGSIIEIMQKPMPLFEIGTGFEYKYNIIPQEYNGEMVCYDSFELYTNGDQIEPIIANLQIEQQNDALIITGTPQKVGHLKIDLLYHSSKSGKITFRLAVLYAKAARKCLPPDPDAPFQVPNEYFKYEKLNCYGKIIGGSIRGRDHENDGKFRDDCFQFIYNDKKNIGAVVVSDGAGSAEYSRKGADIICNSFCDITRSYIEAGKFDALTSSMEDEKITDCKKVLADVVHSCYEKLNSFAKAQNIDLKNFYATMLAYVFIQTPQHIRLLSFVVGDGALVAITAEKAEMLAELDHGEQLNETAFLSETIIDDIRNVGTRFKYFELSPPYSIMAMTDGVFNPWFWGQNAENQKIWFEKHNEIITCLSQNNPENELKSLLSFKSVVSNDDRTIVILKGEKV